MTKRIIALLLCVLMLLPTFTACASKDKDEEVDNGALITMYLTDEIYDFDPINAFYNNETRNVVSMLYDTLFTLDSNGNIKKSLAKSYETKYDEKNEVYVMEIRLNKAYWSNGTQLSADDVVFAWKRLLTYGNSYEAASLLFDIKNARAAKEGDASIDDIGVTAEELTLLRIEFEGKVDYNKFLLNLTSIATAPLLEQYVTKNADWAKKASTMVSSGPFKLGKIIYNLLDPAVWEADNNAYPQAPAGSKAEKPATKSGVGGTTCYKAQDIKYFYLERNIYYKRDNTRDDIDKSVTPHRILVNCKMTDEEILDGIKNNQIFYVGSIPLSIRNDEYVQKKAKVTDALSTFVLALNENAEIGSFKTKLFANAEVRKALSLAIDRDAIANEIVFAEAATGLVCPGIFDTSKSKEFRKVGGNLIASSANITEAKAVLSAASIDASRYSFSIKVAAYDDVHCKIAELVAEAWNALGFTVTVQKVNAIVNNDYFKETESYTADCCDDLFMEDILSKDYEVIGYDSVAYTASAYSVLSSFATAFSGIAASKVDGEYVVNGCRIGYSSERVDALMEAIYYVPYFATLTEDSNTFLGIYETKEEYQAVYNSVKAIYEEFGIKASTKTSDWEKQKTMLLHEVEKVLCEDLPVIPVIFNQNATVTSKQLSKVTSTYYTPAIFQKAKLKNYAKYKEAFADFPEIDWTLVAD